MILKRRCKPIVVLGLCLIQYGATRVGLADATPANHNATASIDIVKLKVDGTEPEANNALVRVNWGQLGPQRGTALLIKAITESRYSDMKMAYMEILGNYYGKHGQAASTLLTEVADDASETQSVREKAVLTLIRVAPSQVNTVRLVTKKLPEWSYDSRAPIGYLASSGCAAKDSLPVLLERLSKDYNNQYELYKAIGTIEAACGGGRTKLTETDLESNDPAVSARAFVDFAQGRVQDGPALDTIISIATRKANIWSEGNRRRAAIDALRATGPVYSKKVAAALLLVAADDNPRISDPATEALLMTAPSDTSVIPELVLGLQSSKAQVSTVAARTLVRFGRRAAPALPFLRAAFTKTATSGKLSGSNLGRYLALVTSIGIKDATIAQAIVEMLPPNSTTVGDRYDMVGADDYLALIAAGVPLGAIPKIQAVLDHKVRWAYGAAVRASGELGPDATCLVPTLAHGLTNDVEDVVTWMNFGSGETLIDPWDSTSTRLETILALGKIGPGAISTVPALRNIAEKTPTSAYDTKLSIAAKQAIAKITRNGTIKAPLKAWQSSGFDAGRAARIEHGLKSCKLLDTDGKRHFRLNRSVPQSVRSERTRQTDRHRSDALPFVGQLGGRCH